MTPPDTARRAAGIGAVVIVVIALAVALALVAAAVGFVGLVLSAFQPRKLDGYVASTVSCSVDAQTGFALVELSLQQLDYSDATPRVEQLESDHATLVGAAAVPLGETLIDMGESEYQDLLLRVDERDDSVRLEAHTQNIVIAIEKSADRVALPAITLWWAPGEPAFVQRVPINLDWDGHTCELG